MPREHHQQIQTQMSDLVRCQWPSTSRHTQSAGQSRTTEAESVYRLYGMRCCRLV